MRGAPVCFRLSPRRAGGVFPLTPGGSSNKELLASTYQSLLRHSQQLGGGRAAGWGEYRINRRVCTRGGRRARIAAARVSEDAGGGRSSF